MVEFILFKSSSYLSSILSCWLISIGGDGDDFFLFKILGILFNEFDFDDDDDDIIEADDDEDKFKLLLDELLDDEIEPNLLISSSFEQEYDVDDDDEFFFLLLCCFSIFVGLDMKLEVLNRNSSRHIYS